MELSNRVAVATINVKALTPPHNVEYTRKVKTVSGIVIWVVHNQTSEQINDVRIFDFGPVADAKVLDSRLALDLHTGPIDAGKRATVPGFLAGHPGDVYTYKISVNDTDAQDPQIEI